jgi:prepilin-type N-terminal cleavage/methylation domain-containing protein
MHRRGFTLTELLIAISIIALITTFAVLQMSGSKGKASVARGLSYSQSLLANYGDEAVAVWNFDECSGATVSDASGYKNNGTMGAAWSTRTPSGKNCSIDTTSGSVTVPDNSTLDIQDHLTVSLWLYETVEYAGYAAIPIQKYGGTADANFRLYVFGSTYTTPRRLQFYATRGGTWAAIGSYTILDLNEWTHVAITYDSTKGGQLFINGSAKGGFSGTGLLSTNTSDLLMGGSFPGYIDDVQIFNRALSARDIQTLYAEGAQTKNIVAKK